MSVYLHVRGHRGVRMPNALCSSTFTGRWHSVNSDFPRMAESEDRGHHTEYPKAFERCLLISALIRLCSNKGDTDDNGRSSQCGPST